MIPLTGQLVDTCAYPPAHGRPDGRLSMLYARFGVPDNERIRMQESYKDAFRFSMIASSFDAVPSIVHSHALLFSFWSLRGAFLQTKTSTLVA